MMSSSPLAIKHKKMIKKKLRKLLSGYLIRG